MYNNPGRHDSLAFAARNTEVDALFGYYEYLKGFPQDEQALFLLRRAASLVKPIMRKRGFKVGVLAEFFPPDPNLQGLNVNRTERIFLRLRPGRSRDTFLPLETITDTLLHELSHIVWGPHDANFHRLWNELRDEHQTLLFKGYTGEGMLGDGHRLGGRGKMPLHEARRQARIRAEKRLKLNKLSKGSGLRLGGSPAGLGSDIRKVIADAAKRRNKDTMGCGAGNKAAESQAAEQTRKNGFRTKAEEDDANDLAIANAMIDLMEKEEAQKLNDLYAPTHDGGLSWTPEEGLRFDDVSRQASNSAPVQTTPRSRGAILRADRPVSRLVATDSFPQQRRETTAATTLAVSSTGKADSSTSWSCNVCTLVNPWNYLCCDACGIEKPAEDLRSKAVPPRKPAAGITTFNYRPGNQCAPKPLGWNCSRCGSFMDTEWWTCSRCGIMKDVS